MTGSIPMGEWLTVMVMAVALGFDAFSLCLGLGMRKLNRWNIVRICFLIACFHMLLPIIGMQAGFYMSSLLGQITIIAAGGLLLLLGGHMIYNAFKVEPQEWRAMESIAGSLLFTLSVSVDSFSVGISLGMFHSNLLFTILAFGLCGGLMSTLGMILGKYAGSKIGEYGEAVGGAILFTFGLMFIF